MDHTYLDPCTPQQSLEYLNQRCAAGEIEVKSASLVLLGDKDPFDTQRLVQTSTFYSGTVAYRGSEAYTSRQCGRYGHHNDKLGGKETFTCRECSATLDRDVHGARNIFLRNLI